MREIHMQGSLSAVAAETTFAKSGAHLEADIKEKLLLATHCGQVRSFAPRRIPGGFDVVRTIDMIRVAGPFADLSQAEEAAAVFRMELRAERIDRKAIMEMAERAERPR
jgi:hypothetical protein